MTFIDYIAMACAILNLLLIIDRLRQSTWSTVKPWLMFCYVCGAIWQAGLLCYAPRTGVWVISAVGSIGLSVGLVMTHQHWMHGVPHSARSQPAPLGPPELDTRP